MEMSLHKLVKDELSGSIAKSYVSQVTRFHRVQASTMFHEAAEYVKGELVKIGLSNANIEQFPADGKHKYWTHTSPMGWTARSAELRLVEPEEKLLAAYEDTPQSLHTYSKGTTPEGVMAELVDVGAGTKPKDYEGKDIKGKFVLASGPRARLVHEEAVYKFGAVGVITDSCYEFPNVRESLDIPDAHAYQSIWPEAEDLDKVAFGFSLSKRQGNQLRALLKDGKKVTLHAKVDAELFPGKLDVLTATIQGATKPNEEVFLVAHLCHPKPSANDNASGSGLLLEIARTMKALMDSGKIKPPARTIRFFWVPETLGSVAYLTAHEDSREKLVAGVNLDMVGQNQEICKSSLTLDRTPDSCPSYLNDLVFNLMEQSIKEFDRSTSFGPSSTFRYRTITFSGGSDHMEFTETTTHAPCIMLLQWPDLFYHTSMDTIDKVSEDSLKRVGWIAAVAALTLANAGMPEAFLFANETAARGIARIEDTTREAIQEIFNKKDDPKLKENPSELAKELAKTADTYTNKLAHFVAREKKALESVKRLGTNEELEAFIDNCLEEVTDLECKQTMKITQTLNLVAKNLGLTIPTLSEETAATDELKKLIPKRLFKGTFGLTLKKELDEREYEWYEKAIEKDRTFNLKLNEVFNFMNGNRNAHEIMKAAAAEYTEIKPDDMLKILKDMQKLGLVAAS